MRRRESKPNQNESPTSENKGESDTSTASPKRLVIPSRPVISQGVVADQASTDDTLLEPPSAPPLKTNKRTAVVPIPVKAQSDPVSVKATKPDSGSNEKPVDVSAPQPKEPIDVKQPPMTNEPPQSPRGGASAAIETATETDSGVPTKQAPDTRKDVEAAAENAKRETELEQYIGSRQYFVPINAIAHKRSIKVSLGLTLLVLLLAIILIDLMLDTGIILLLLRVPHTHFFSLGR